MAYEYIKKTYGVCPIVGHRVTFTEKGCKLTGVDGVIVRHVDNPYVYVRFPGAKYGVPCHPKSLEYHEN